MIFFFKIKVKNIKEKNVVPLNLFDVKQFFDLIFF